MRAAFVVQQADPQGGEVVGGGVAGMDRLDRGEGSHVTLCLCNRAHLYHTSGRPPRILLLNYKLHIPLDTGRSTNNRWTNGGEDGRNAHV